MGFKEDLLDLMQKRQQAEQSPEDLPEPPEEDVSDKPVPYSSLARPGAPEPKIHDDMDGESKSDPMMDRLATDEERLQSLRKAQLGANTLSAINAAGQQLALGSNRPQISDAIINTQNKAGEDALKLEQHSAENRARVMGAIEARSQRQEMAQDRMKDRALQRDMLNAQREAQLNEKHQKQEDMLRTPYGQANTPEDAKKLKDAYESKQNFDAKIQEMIDLRQKHGGGTIMNREDVARGKQLSKDLLLEYKNMAKLGVLSQSDEKILNAIIPPDPLAYSMTPGQDPILSNLQKFKEDAARDFKTKVSTRIKPGEAILPEDEQPESQPKVGQPDVEAKIQAFMMKNGIEDREEAVRILKEHGKL